jgi:hypothetical protein
MNKQLSETEISKIINIDKFNNIAQDAEKCGKSTIPKGLSCIVNKHLKEFK